MLRPCCAFRCVADWLVELLPLIDPVTGEMATVLDKFLQVGPIKATNVGRVPIETDFSREA